MPEPAAEAEAAPDPAPEPPPAAAPAADDESILAAATQAATTGALSEVARAVTTGRQGAMIVGDGRTLEDLVREALVPELKAWLDSNLAPLVEQIVRDEIKKMVRRAEDT